jgi:hypothetical protein
MEFQLFEIRKSAMLYNQTMQSLKWSKVFVVDFRNIYDPPASENAS